MTITITTADINAMKRVLFEQPRDRRAGQVDFKVRPVSEEWRYDNRLPAYRTAVANVAYILRDSAPDDRFGRMPAAFAERRCELRGSGLLLPASAPIWASHDYAIWEEADAAAVSTGDPTAVAAWHCLLQIPDGIAARHWNWTVRSFLERELVARGAAVAWAVHALQGEADWLVKPHAHAIVTARHWRHDHRHGQRHPAWIGSWSAQKKLEYAWRRRVALPQQFLRIRTGGTC